MQGSHWAKKMFIAFFIAFFLPLYVTLADLTDFIVLPKANENEAAIQVSGMISPYITNASVVMIHVHVKTDFPVKTLYCESHNPEPVINQTQLVATDDDVSMFRVTLPANTGVLDMALGMVGVRCTVFVNQQLRHFKVIYGNEGGARLTEDKVETGMEQLMTLYKHTPHLLWLVIITFVLSLLSMIVIPSAMVVKSRKKRY